MTVLIGIDCGSQSAKVVAYRPDGTVVAQGRQALQPMSRPSHGVVMHPGDDLWDATVAACQATVAALPDGAQVAGIGLCPIRCCKAFLRSDGSLVEPVISWMDERAYRAYLPVDPATAFATTSSGYLGWRLTGRRVDTAANNIELQWPIDTRTWRWSDEPTDYERHGVPRRMLFDLVDPGDAIGELTPAAAADLGLPAGTPVVATANDKAVEMLGTGAIGPSTALLSLGTYICAMVHGVDDVVHPVRSAGEPQHYWTNFASIPGRYLYESNGIRRGMWMLSWLLDLLGPEFAERAASEGVDRETLLEREARHVPAGCDGLLAILDWLAPDAAPFRKGTWLGFDARHTRGHLYRSLIEAIALTMAGNVAAMCAELRIELDDLVVSGGGARSDLFMQIVAAAFALPAWRVEGGGASLGAAICAAAGTGVHPDIATAATAMAPRRVRFEPSPHDVDLYRRIAPLYPAIRPATDPIYQRTYPIFHTVTPDVTKGV